MGKIRKGDKVEFSLSVDSLIRKGQIPGYDTTFLKGDFILGKIEILEIFATPELVNADENKEKLKYKEKQIKPPKTVPSLNDFFSVPLQFFVNGMCVP
jgi:hypothetical protein